MTNESKADAHAADPSSGPQKKSRQSRSKSANPKGSSKGKSPKAAKAKKQVVQPGEKLSCEFCPATGFATTDTRDKHVTRRHKKAAAKATEKKPAATAAS